LYGRETWSLTSMEENILKFIKLPTSLKLYKT
jgi:hypothetical protein